MKLTAPFMISSRLMPAIQIAGVTISLNHVGFDAEYKNKPRYGYAIDLPDGTSHEGDDLSGHGDLPAMMESLLSFLGACGEGLAYESRNPGRESENSDLFPRPVAEWASQNLDEIFMMQEELLANPECVED